ncbi:endolytic transglycosylase MltG [Endozoicomonas gorgoniicola]|uniref:Endolytic murein transglycosylase n=1 Tax=Endozoicomonas gorgoniicola TaxID=1234144 RepID=A0ABT3MVK3_9GAMM|nr:endolytic transglycosylase MltG [Endozoicomonas gorgoniicola]MCW7553398.1 endolytic transglycosylase MltG [Endozoicomonas gorgoniicola]
MVRKLLLGVFSGFFTLILLAGLAWMSLNWYAEQPLRENPDEVLEFTIRPGDSLIRVASRLSDAGWIKFPQVIRLLARIDNVAGDIHAGDYLIPGGINKYELLKMFVSGDVRYYDVVLVEGSTVGEALQVLNEHEKLSQPLDEDAFQGLLTELGIEGNPEGQFYPDTYFFESGDTVESVLRRANARMSSVLAEEWEARSKNLPYETPYEALIMASLIEKETGAGWERPEISGVFVRRLGKRMRLQTDPTVIYGMGDRYQGRLSRRMLREDTPYNTYTRHGLPPTPIALVGREAINAALNPKGGKSLYFVARGDGTHHFSETLAEHNRAVRKYQIVERREDYRSTLEAQ